ncbi:MAG: hypothetical protein ACRENE_16780 [Polyangiaceae bacterium]
MDLRGFRVMIVWALTGLAAVSTACSPSTSPSSSAAGSSCKAAGGTCVLGAATCAKQAASNAQDCNPPPENPGGGFCCIAPGDGGVNNGSGGGSSSSGGVAADGCSVSNPCVAGAGGCPSNGLPVPNDGDPCNDPGLECYGYGTLSCGLSLTCLANRTWQVSCPAHPSGLDSGSCGCADGG